MCTALPSGQFERYKEYIKQRPKVIQRLCNTEVYIEDDDYNMVRLETGEASYGAGFHKFKNGING